MRVKIRVLLINIIDFLQSSDANQDNQQSTLESNSKQLRELLAEAAGASYEEPATTSSPTNLVPSTIEERLRAVFNLPSKELLRGGTIDDNITRII